MRLLVISILMLAAVIYGAIVFTHSLRRRQRQVLYFRTGRTAFRVGISLAAAAFFLVTLSALLAEVHF